MTNAEVLERHDVTVTYLEQTTPWALSKPPSPAIPHSLTRATKIPAAFYRYLFDIVGGPHRWVSRRYLSDDELSAIINADDAEIYILSVNGWPAGYLELNLAVQDEVEIKFFGLVPDAQGMRIGPWFLYEAIRLAWAHQPNRVIIETCTLDNPAALRLYQRMGFSVYGQGAGVVEWRG